MRIFFQAWFLLASVLLRGILELEKALQLSGDRLQLAHEANRMTRGMARWCSYGVVGLLHGENLTMSFISAMYFARSLRSVCARSLGGGNIERDLRLQIHEMQQESGLITYAFGPVWTNMVWERTVYLSLYFLAHGPTWPTLCLRKLDFYIR